MKTLNGCSSPHSSATVRAIGRKLEMHKLEEMIEKRRIVKNVTIDADP